MLTFRKLLLALTAVAAISAPALAQQQQTPRTFDGVMLYYPDTGRMVMARMDKKSIDMAMKRPSRSTAR